MIKPESSNEFPWISIGPLVKPHANYCVYMLRARCLRPAQGRPEADATDAAALGPAPLGLRAVVFG